MVGTGVAERNLCTCARIEWLRMPEIIQIPKEEKGLKHMKTKDLVLCAMFVALIAVGAFIKIPVPVVPFTLQFLFTMLAGLLLGPVNGALAVVVYIVLGLIGLPIFTQGGGPGYIFQPSFGYIIGFAVAAYVNGKIANAKTHPSYRRLLGANFLGLFILLCSGSSGRYRALYCGCHHRKTDDSADSGRETWIKDEQGDFYNRYGNGYWKNVCDRLDCEKTAGERRGCGVL